MLQSFTISCCRLMMICQFDNLDFNGPYGPYDVAKAYIKQQDTSHDSWHVCVCVHVKR